MSKIALIATSNEMYEYARIFRSNLKHPENFEIYLGYMNGALYIAEKLNKTDVDVIICRGASGRMIVNSGINIPIIDMPLTDIEVTIQ